MCIRDRWCWGRPTHKQIYQIQQRTSTDHSTVVCLVSWPLNESEAWVDLALIGTDVSRILQTQVSCLGRRVPLSLLNIRVLTIILFVRSAKWGQPVCKFSLKTENCLSQTWPCVSVITLVIGSSLGEEEPALYEHLLAHHSGGFCYQGP